MKKKIFGFILLLIFSGAVFYFGWVQISLQGESYGIVFTKTSGWSSKIIKPGDFVWMWEKVIPKNMTLYSFPVKINKSSINVNGDLPSAAVYSSYLGGSAEFKYNIDLDVFYSINPEILPEIVKNESLKPENLSSWYEEYEDKIKVRILDFLFANADIEETGNNKYFKYAGFEENLEKYLNENLDDVIISKITIKQLVIPDFDLYKDAKKQYYQVFNKRQEILTRSMNSSAEDQVKENIRIEKLKKYGKLFSEYPVLIKFLALGVNESEIDQLIEILEKGN